MSALHPWADEPVPGGRPLEWLWHHDLAIPPRELWDLVIDTSRFNRALGLSRMQFTPVDGVLHGTGVNGRVRHEWVEVPWDWVAGRYLISRRIYSKGFPLFSRVIYRLESIDDEHTRLWVYFGWIPRSWLGRMALKIGMPSIQRGYHKVVDEMLAARAQGQAPLARAAPQLSLDARARVATVRESLQRDGLPVDPVARLSDYVATADDMDVYRMQLLRMARAWNVDEEDLLRTALYATRAGLLDMSWDVVCPHCRGVSGEARTLGDVPLRGSCDVCHIDFDTDSDRALEITFHVHPSIRSVPKVYYCSAEPSSKRHIELQQRLAPGQSRTLATSMAAGSYRLRKGASKEYAFVEVGDGDGALTWRASELPGSARLAPDPSIELINDTDDEQMFVIENVAWTEDALHPARLFNFQEFRDLFSEEYVATDVQLSVGEQSILFTDIVGSTRFYVDRGDPGAFMEVKKHFVEVYDLVKRHHGAVVKTIGDACMASFSNPIDAVACARAIHDCFCAGRDDTPIRVRASINTGPCIAVRLNSNIDYFGTTVNLAAKLQACAGAGEIALSQSTYDKPGVREYLAQQGAGVESLDFEARALGETLSVYRIGA